MGGKPLAISTRLNEPKPGCCPVCRENWTADPEYHCACTRPRPGDEQEMIKAYAKSAAHRDAKLAADALEAGRISAPIRRQQQRQGNVVPINRASARRRLGTRRVR
jgi:hypothetical protein